MMSLIWTPLFIRCEVDSADECSRRSLSWKSVNLFPVSMFNTVKYHQCMTRLYQINQRLKKNHFVFSVWPSDIIVRYFPSISTSGVLNVDKVFCLSLLVHQLHFTEIIYILQCRIDQQNMFLYELQKLYKIHQFQIKEAGTQLWSDLPLFQLRVHELMFLSSCVIFACCKYLGGLWDHHFHVQPKNWSVSVTGSLTKHWNDDISHWSAALVLDVFRLLKMLKLQTETVKLFFHQCKIWSEESLATYLLMVAVSVVIYSICAKPKLLLIDEMNI